MTEQQVAVSGDEEDVCPAPDEPFWVSPSALETFELCPRKWAFRAIDRVKRDTDDDEKRALGRRVHDVLARWLEKGEVPDAATKEGRIALRGVHCLPLPKSPGLEVEQWFGLRVGGVHFRGIKDVQVLVPGTTPRVMDHKTTGNLTYAKDADDLRDDYQACLYATDAMVKSRSQACDLRWNYISTKTDVPSRAVDVTLTRADVEQTLARAVHTAGDMKTIRDAGVAARGVPCCPSACNAFGGCDYRDLCGEFTPIERMTMGQPESLKDFLAGLSAKKPEINPPASTISAPAPSPEPTPAPAATRLPILPPAGDTPTEVVIPKGSAVPTLPSPAAAPPPAKAKKTTRVDVVDANAPTVMAAEIAGYAPPAGLFAGRIARLALAEFLEDVGAALSKLGSSLKMKEAA